MTCRHHRRRSRAKYLKADCVVMLDLIVGHHCDVLSDKEVRQIAELRMRLAPPRGVKAPINLTGFTKGRL